MKKPFLVAAALLFGIGSAHLASAVTSETMPSAGAPATSMPPPAGTSTILQTVKGQVLKIEGEHYMIKDPSGKEVRLQVTNETKMDGVYGVGDLIEAQVNQAGNAMVIKKEPGSHPKIENPVTSESERKPH